METLPEMDGELVAAWRSFVTASRGRAGGAVRGRGSQGERRAHLVVAEAAAGWAEALRRGGDSRGAAAATAASTRSLEMCAGAATPLLAVSSPVVLSRREREISDLAAAGLSNIEIAERLYLSRRTVENHLQRGHVKLGVAKPLPNCARHSDRQTTFVALIM